MGNSRAFFGEEKGARRKLSHARVGVGKYEIPNALHGSISHSKTQIWKYSFACPCGGLSDGDGRAPTALLKEYVSIDLMH